MHRLTELPPSVQNYLGEFVRRWKRVVIVHAVGASLAALSIWILLACAADRLFHLPSALRLASLTTGTLTAMIAGLIRLRKIRGPIDWVGMAGVIEQYDSRFGQALITVTSCFLGAPDHRGSDEILDHLVRDVEQNAAARPSPRLLTLRSAGLPWFIALTVTSAIVSMAVLSGSMPEIGGPRLLARFVEPLADIPPVTTTLLAVHPGDVDVTQSDALHVAVEARRLGNSPVELFINDDGTHWTHYPMDDAGSGRFTFTINTVSRDLLYKVGGGDAVAGPYAVRVKRPPAVAEYRLSYTYPAYTRRAPSSVKNTDGAIEGPVGSEVVLTIVATEPLQSALMTVGNQKILMQRASPDEPNIRQTTLRVQNDASYGIDLISTREVRGGADKLPIRAAADHPPLVRLFQAGQTLRLNPRDVLPLTWQAIDDYGLDNVAIVAEMNADTAVRIPLQLNGDHRRAEQTVNFDLASLKFKIGDVLSLTIAARDTAGQETLSDELRVLISPRSIDQDAHERIDELRAASGFAATVAAEFDAAAKANDEVEAEKDHQSPAFLAAEARAARHLSSASEAATLLRQALLRAAAHSDSPELSVAIENFTDAAHQETRLADDLFRSGGSSEGMGNGSRGRLHGAVDLAKDLSTQVRTVFVGQSAFSLLADREDLKAAKDAHPATETVAVERLTKTLARSNDEIAAGAADIGINPAAPDVDNQLRARIDAASAVIHSKHPVDFAAAARDWSQELQKDPHRHIGLDARLSAAAEVQAVRPDADLEYARDLELASRAAASIETSAGQTAPGKPAPAAQLNALASSVEVFQRVHNQPRPAGVARADAELKSARAAVSHARDEISKWIPDSGKGGKTQTATAHSTDLQSLALRAGAEAAHHDYKHVAEADKALVQKLTDAARKPLAKPGDGESSPAASQAVEEKLAHIQQTAEEVSRHMTAAEKVDRIGQTEAKIVEEAKSAKTASRDLVGRQQSVAEQIAAVEREQRTAAFPAGAAPGDMDDPNWRGRATAAVLAAQEQLAAMPQQLALLQEADNAHRKAVERAAAARHEADTAGPDRKLMANRDADQAEDARDSQAKLDQAIAPIAPAICKDLADRLEPFAPEAAGAHDAVAGPLAAAFTSLQSACHDGNSEAVARSATDILKSIDGIQHELRLTQEQFTTRDPLIAAKWFARAAADSLARHPGDIKSALAHQANVSLALSRAWDHSIHRAAELRLAELPSLQTVYAPLPATAGQTSTATAAAPNANSRDWVRLHARENDDLTASMPDPDPPGYEEALRLYFEALGKAGGNEKGKE